MQYSVALILSALTASVLAAPASDFSRWNNRKGSHGNGNAHPHHHGNYHNGDKVILSVSIAEASATSETKVTVPLDGSWVEVDTRAFAFAEAEVIVEKVHGALCTIAIDDSFAETDVTVENGWGYTISSSKSVAESESKSISCVPQYGN